jgi:hypothetical protein
MFAVMAATYGAIKETRENPGERADGRAHIEAAWQSNTLVAELVQKVRSR